MSFQKGEDGLRPSRELSRNTHMPCPRSRTDSHFNIGLRTNMHTAMHFSSFVGPFLALAIFSSLFLLVPVSSTVLNHRPKPYWKVLEQEFVSWLDSVKVRVGGEPHFRHFSTRVQNVTIITVDINGQGNFTSIQKAVDSIPNRPNSGRYIIKIKAGIYKEKIEISRYKSAITFQGEGRNNTIIVWNDTASEVNSTYRSATVAIDSQYFVALNITVQNSAPAQTPGAVQKQAVALRVSGNNAAFYGCGILGHQDTLYDHKGMHYFVNCYIEGSIDFIFGNALSLYKNCELHVVPETPGSLTAQKRAKADSNTGFSFVNCSITGTGIVYLGRAWGRYSRVVFLYTYMENIVIPEGWHNWGDARRNERVYYGQYQCSGPGAIANMRVPWCHELTDSEAQPFLGLQFINGDNWVPFA